MYITKTVVGRHTKGQVTIKKTPGGGDAIVAGPFASVEDARQSRVFTDTQRHLVLAESEEVRLHAPNGAYLFSVRYDDGVPSIVYDRKFSTQLSEYETPVELYPWLKLKESKT